MGEPQQHSAADEATPLLAASSAGPTLQANETVPAQEAVKHNNQDRPLPKVQIFLLCYARLVEPLAYFGIFPFINQMIWKTGNIAESDVGFYSGMIESLFSLTQMCLMVPWGRAADRLGRKPVLVFSLVGVGFATALFGMSKTLWQMILFRCIAGIFAGTIVTIRAMITENSTPKTQARAFSLFAFSGNLGIFLGPLLGGALSNPADQYPAIFDVHFFREYPYALPTIVSGSIGISAAIISALFVKETLIRKSVDDIAAAPPMTVWEVIKSPGVAIVLYIYGHVTLLGLAYTAVVPVFWFTQPDLGGFGFSPLEISLFLGVAGISQAVWLLVAFPPLQRKFSTGGVLRACTIVWPISFLTLPLCSILLRQDLKLAFWIIAPITTVVGAGVSMGFTAVQLALNDIAPSPLTLGTLNALALTLVSGIRAVAPALFASLYATGVRNHILSGYFIWVFLVLLAVAAAVAVRWLPERAQGKLVEDSDEE